MSPVSRGRKKTKGSRSSGRSTAGKPALRQANLTPDYSTVRRTEFTHEPPAEAKLLTALSDAWQQLVQGHLASHCIHAATSIQSALANWGLESELVTVAVQVTWPNMVVPIGNARPAWQSDGSWNGHLVVWVPRLSRMLDATLYQANWQGAPARFTRGAVMQLPYLPGVGEPFGFSRDGAVIKYQVVADVSQSWKAGLPSRGAAELADVAREYQKLVAEMAEMPEMDRILQGLTDRSLAAAIAAARR